MPIKTRISSLVLLQLAAPYAFAQDAAIEMARCAATESESERIACLERVIRDMSGDTTQPAATEAKPLPSNDGTGTPDTQEPGTATSRSTDNAADSGEPSPAAVIMTAPEPQAADANDVTPVNTATDTTQDGESELARELGAEQVAVRKGEKQEAPRVTVMVVSHAEVGYQKLRVQLDNGQVWQQTDGDRVRAITKLRNTPTFAVELWETRSGGYRMHIPELNMTLRVRRLN